MDLTQISIVDALIVVLLVGLVAILDISFYLRGPIST